MSGLFSSKFMVFAVVLTAVKLFFMCSTAVALTLDSFYSPGVVLQQGRPIPIRGSGNDGERVSVKFANFSRAIDVKGGRWEVVFDRLPVGGPWQLDVVGINKITVSDVWVGDVWLCSGQSNMAMRVAGTDTPVMSLRQDDFKFVHLFSVPKVTDASSRPLIDGRWEHANNKAVSRFSATCFFFGSTLANQLQIPIGLIDSSVGGTFIEAWISDKAIQLNQDAPIIKDFFLKRKAQETVGLMPKRPNTIMPSILFDSMIEPLGHFPIKGLLWYQGESNTGRPYQYLGLLKSLVMDWRRLWGDDSIPFIYIQLSGYGALKNEVERSSWARLREEQLKAEAAIPSSAMVVSFDLGDFSIHPPKKKPLGERAAFVALSKVYGKHYDSQGPRLVSATFSEHGAVVRFNAFENCLRASEPQLKGFYVAGEDKSWHSAIAIIDGTSVFLSNPKVVSPVAVRYAWGNRPVGNLTSCSGMPASPFRTDNWAY